MSPLMQVLARSVLFALVTAVVAGCPPVEPRPFHLAADAGPGGSMRPDASCDPAACQGYCVERGEKAGQCAPLPTTCGTNLDCAPHSPARSCVHPRRPNTTETATIGRCDRLPYQCETGAQCGPGQRCTAVGQCVRGLVLVEGESSAESAFMAARLIDAPMPAHGARCRDQADCGGLSVCAAGVCSPCDATRPCTRGVCEEGRCVQPERCAAERDCFIGNACTTLGGVSSCRRAVQFCDREDSADSFANPMGVPEAVISGLSICGEDEDWFRLDLSAHEGARITVRTSSVARFLPRLDVVDANQGRVEPVGLLELPELVAMEIGATALPRSLRLAVSSLDVSGRYDLEIEKSVGLCAGDGLDLYGDRSAIGAPATYSAKHRVCAGDVDRLAILAERTNRINVSLLAPPSGAEIGVALLAADGTRIASAPVAMSSGATITVALSAVQQAETSTWTLVIESFAAPSRGVPYQLAVRTELGARIDACRMPAATAADRITLSGERQLGRPSCLPTGATNDRLIRIEPPRARALIRATVRPTLRNTGHKLALALLTDCLDDRRAVTCDISPRPGFGASIEHIATSTAPLYLLMSATANDAPPFDLDVSSVSDSNFTCYQGAGRRISTSTTVTVDTEAATDTVRLETRHALCGAAGLGAGPDRFFDLTITSTGVNTNPAVLTLTGPDGGLLWVSDSAFCQDFVARCQSAAAISGGLPARILLNPARSTNYLVAVDGVAAEHAGVYQLAVNLDPECIRTADCGAGAVCDNYACVRQPPMNDRCPGTLLDPSRGPVVIEGTRALARDDYVHDGCGEGGTTLGAGQPDVVYAVNVPEGTRKLRAEILGAQFDTVVALRYGDCTAGASQVACNDDLVFGSDLRSRVVIDNPRAGAYSIIVDGFGGSVGESFTLEVGFE